MGLEKAKAILITLTNCDLGHLPPHSHKFLSIKVKGLDKDIGKETKGTGFL